MVLFRSAVSIIFLLVFLQLSRSEVYSFRHYKVEDGLSFNTARNIIQDRSGYIWIGTEDCLNRFDGYSFKIFRSNGDGPDHLVSNYISALLQGKQDLIYVGTDQGISTFNPLNEKFSRLNAKTRDSVGITGEVNNMVEDQNGNIWISTYGQGAFRYSPTTRELEQFTVFSQEGGLYPFDMVNYIYVDSKNNIWLATRSKEMLLRFDHLSNTFMPETFSGVEGKSLSGNIFRILEDSNHELWFGMWDQGLVNFNPVNGKLTFHLSPNKPGGIRHVHEIFEYKPGMLMVGSDDGLCMFNTSTFQSKLVTPNEADPSSLSDKFVYPIFKDRESGIWIGTYFGGVNYLPPSGRVFERYNHSRYTNSVNGNVIGGFAEDKDGNIWIASDDGGLNVLDTSTGLFKAFMPNLDGNAISYHNVHGLCWDGNYLWVGTYSGGLNRYDSSSGKFKHYTTLPDNPNTIDGTSVYSVHKDSQGTIWVGTMSGINRYNRSGDSFVRVKILGVTTVDIKDDHDGMIWFATWGKGLFRYDTQRDRWDNFTNQPGDNNSIAGNQLNCLMIDGSGKLWIGTTAGLCCYDAGNQLFKTVPLNAPNSSICSIVDGGEVLWLTTAKGLVRYNKMDGKCQFFTRDDGLLSDQFIFNSGFKSSTGKIYIGTAAGFNAFFPSNITSNAYVPPVMITRLEIFNKEVALAQYGTVDKDAAKFEKIDLSYKDNVFSLGFVALSYINPAKNKYAYKLEGFDSGWNEVSGQLKATYTNLPAGNYTFRVRASNNDGVWNDDGASLLVVIHPPVWQTLPFKILYAIVIIAFAVLLVRMQKLRIDRKHRERIEQLNHEKEKEVYDAKISFFTMIAHEIRTPVSLIIGPLEKMMSSAGALPSVIHENLKIIDRNSQRLLLLVNQLLDFRKVEQGALVVNPVQTKVYDLLKSVCDRFSPLIEQHGMEFVLDCPDKSFCANVDQEFITKMLSNLLSNALKFADSKIVLNCRVQKASQTFVLLVTDDGSGISDIEKQKIFAPFYQVHSMNKSGTGIGLSLVKNLVETHNGSIEVMDALPYGVSFSLTLPLQFVPAPAQDAGLSYCQDQGLNASTGMTDHSAIITRDCEKQVLLVIDDNQEMRQFLHDSFSDEYQVITAEDGEDGLLKLKDNEIHLVISDLMMPRMDGQAFCIHLKENILTSHIPIIILTAKTDVDSKIEGMNSGADAYVEKPFSVKFLKAQINNLIESRKALRAKYTEMPFVSISSMAGNQADEAFLTQLNTIIEENVSNLDLNIDMLVEKLCMSRSGFFTKIKSLAGVTPNELIQVIRLKKAAELLLTHQYRINEVSYMVGYNDPSYFSKCFLKQFGVRPGDFISKYRAV